MTVAINGTSGLTFNDASTQNTATKYGMVNRIINGAMVMAQRGTSAVTTDGAFVVDRFRYFYGNSGAYSSQQSSTAPAGFVKSIFFTTTTASGSLGATQQMVLNQQIEGFNVADLNWGTANAQPVTISFWVQSSLTGTFGGSLRNNAQNRSYPFSFTISSANTFEYKTIVVAGDTSGTWLTDNNTGISLCFGLGVGSTYSGTAGSWSANDFRSTTGAVSVIGTLNATFYITGVQLEKGSTATSFDYRPYGTELALCQRYYFKNIASSYTAFMAGFTDSSVSAFVRCDLPTTMRTTPTFTQSGNELYRAGGSITIGAITNRSNQTSGSILIATTGAVAGDGCRFESSASGGAGGVVEFSAEL